MWDLEVASQLKSRKKWLEKLKQKTSLAVSIKGIFIFSASISLEKTVFSVTQSKQDAFDLSFAINVISNHKKAKKHNCLLPNFI